MDDVTQYIDEEHGNMISMEKMNFSTFKTKFTIFRRSYIPSRVVSLSEMQLPNDSCLHLVDWLHPSREDVTVDMSDTLLVNEKYQKFNYDVIAIPTIAEDPILGVNDRYRLNTSRFSKAFQTFYNTHRNKIYKVVNLNSVLSRSTILTSLNYNAILHTILTGTFTDYRRFEVVLRTILHNVVNVDNIDRKLQYIHIPLSDKIYKRNQFELAFNKIAYQTVRVKGDWSFYLMIHLLSLVKQDSDVSLFKKLTQGQLDVLNIVLSVGDKAIVYNLGDLVTMDNSTNFYQMVLRHITTLKLKGKVEFDIDNLDDTEFEKVVDDHATQDVPDSTTDDTDLVPDHHTDTSDDETGRKTGEDNDIEHAVVSIPDTGNSKSTTSSDTSEDNGIAHSAPSIPITSTTSAIDNKSDSIQHTSVNPTKSPTTNRIDTAVKNIIANATHLTPSQKERVTKVASLYKTIEIGGTTIAELLDNTPEPHIDDNKLSSLSNMLVDRSMMLRSLLL